MRRPSEERLTMPRLPIALEDTLPGHRNGSPRSIGRATASCGCGISLDVWQTCFEFADGKSRFARLEDEVNLTLVSLRDAINSARRVPFVLSAEALEKGVVSPLAGRLGFGALNDDVLESLGDVLPEQLQVGGSVEALLRLHDDCFFSVRHRSRDILHHGLQSDSSVRVHEHYADVNFWPRPSKPRSLRVCEQSSKESGVWSSAPIKSNAVFTSPIGNHGTVDQQASWAQTPGH